MRRFEFVDDTGVEEFGDSRDSPRLDERVELLEARGVDADDEYFWGRHEGHRSIG